MRDYILIIALIGSIITTIFGGGVLGADIHKHVDTAKSIIENGISMISDGQNHFYPPGYHFVLTMFYVLGRDWLLYGFIILAQILLLPSALWLIMKIVSYFSNDTIASYSAFLLLGSLAVVDRGMQAIPQAFDYILFPLFILAYVERFPKFFTIILGTFMVWFHGPFPLFLFLGLALYTLFCEHKKTYSERVIVFVSIAFLSLPILYGIFSNFFGLYDQFAGRELSTHTRRFMFENPEFGFKYLGLGISAWLIAIVGSLLNKHLRNMLIKELPKKYRIYKVALFWILGLLPLSIFMVDRFLGYLALPLSIVIASYAYSSLPIKKINWLLVYPSVLLFLYYVVILGAAHLKF